MKNPHLMNRFNTLLVSLSIMYFLLMIQACGGGGGGATTYTAGGSVNGLTSGTLVLQNNGDELNLTADGSYVFAIALKQGSTYNVTILTQPANHFPCTVNNGSGTVAAQNITSIDIICIPVGFFHKGTANVKEEDDMTALNIDDFQGMVEGDRFMLMSVATDLLYDGRFTSFSGEDYIAEVTIYKTGAFKTKAAVTGTLTSDSKMTGDLEGDGAGNGSFELTYALSNNTLATLARIETEFDKTLFEGKMWGASVFGLGRVGGFTITDESGFFGVATGDAGLLFSCSYFTGSSLSPIAASSLYRAEIVFKFCNENLAANSDGNYSGLATLLSIDNPDDGILLAFTKDDTTVMNELSQLGFFAVYRLQDYP